MGEEVQVLRGNISDLNRAIDRFLNEKNADPKQWAKLIEGAQLIIAQSIHVHGENFDMESSTHAGGLVPQWKKLKDEANLPINDNTHLRISKGGKIKQLAGKLGIK